MEHRDDIDRWLYENVGVIPGCCSSIDSLKYNVAREVAEKLWGGGRNLSADIGQDHVAPKGEHKK